MTSRKPPDPAKRSPHWPAVRAAHLKEHPACELCGNSDPEDVEAHHVEPFHLNREKELDRSNLITLCDCSDSPDMIGADGKGLNCHQWAGHLGDWKSINPRVREVCKKLRPLIARPK